MATEKILIYGAGAMGRGCLAPTFYKLGYEILFVDNDVKLINELKSRREYLTAFVRDNKYELVSVKYSGAFLLGEEDSILDKVSLVFLCVGPDNAKLIAPKLKNAHTIICFENDWGVVDIVKEMSGNKNCYFAIPDVISSNSACQMLKSKDKLCLISELPEIAIEECNFKFAKGLKTFSKEEMKKYWNCKFYIHNATHAAVAFLGKLFGAEYIHEAMKIEEINQIVESIMNSITKSMKIKNMVDHKFIDFYARKEMSRFRDELLFDPIARVARDPLRKLRGNDRLIQSARFMHEANQDTSMINLVISVAINDAIKNYYPELMNKFGAHPTIDLILQEVSEMNEQEELYKKIKEAHIKHGLYLLKKRLVQPLRVKARFNNQL